MLLIKLCTLCMLLIQTAYGTSSSADSGQAHQGASRGDPLHSSLEFIQGAKGAGHHFIGGLRSEHEQSIDERLMEISHLSDGEIADVQQEVVEMIEKLYDQNYQRHKRDIGNEIARKFADETGSEEELSSRKEQERQERERKINEYYKINSLFHHQRTINIDIKPSSELSDDLSGVLDELDRQRKAGQQTGSGDDGNRLLHIKGCDLLKVMTQYPEWVGFAPAWIFKAIAAVEFKKYCVGKDATETAFFADELINYYAQKLLPQMKREMEEHNEELRGLIDHEKGRREELAQHEQGHPGEFLGKSSRESAE